MLELVDETTSNWAFDNFGVWFDRKIVSHEKYLVHLNRIVVAAARRGKVVIVGRGANFLLPRNEGLAVRIVAPERYRVEQVMRRHKLAETEARRFIAELDRGRREFVLRFFHHDITDPHLFDLVINTDRIGPQAAADAIVEAYRCWSKDRPSRSPERGPMPTRVMRETAAASVP
jgi:cytidylate kinase